MFYQDTLPVARFCIETCIKMHLLSLSLMITVCQPLLTQLFVFDPTRCYIYSNEHVEQELSILL